jgi:hypothetical protein
MLRLLLPSAALLLIAVACVPPAPGTAGGADEGADGGPLVSTLSVRTGEGAVQLALQVTNRSEAPVEVRFRSGQSYDFAVRQGGRELWRWSADMGFTQALRTLTLAPGETWEFEERWTPPAGTTGALEAWAALASDSHPLERTAEFRLP